jgi:hypothetical protein
VKRDLFPMCLEELFAVARLPVLLICAAGFGILWLS